MVGSLFVGCGHILEADGGSEGAMKSGGGFVVLGDALAVDAGGDGVGHDSIIRAAAGLHNSKIGR